MPGQEAKRIMGVELDTPLLDDVPLQDKTWWRVTHAAGFLTGGVTFLIGTYLFYLPATDFLGYMSGLLYIIGSCGFLYCDVGEFFTFTDDKWLRLNISMSMVGSALNIIGSIGFLPNVMAISPLLGILGFIGGSLAIGVSQAWKVVRISGDGGICSSKDNFTAACVEGGACLGAWGFFFGTLLFWIWPFEGTRMQVILALWMFGSSAFTFGGLSLIYRHAVIRVLAKRRNQNGNNNKQTVVYNSNFHFD
ncbi:unnamed protein product [Polarella glacialis]|uniref:YrhK domain-containing protein n=1 Tax=Polarella glacialis TaxID=89957 RepID=A0A813GDL4_POLGL|nr:unnamed protein product [Polarella glacialis]